MLHNAITICLGDLRVPTLLRDPVACPGHCIAIKGGRGVLKKFKNLWMKFIASKEKIKNINNDRFGGVVT